jgi:phage baseplate assembly protein W
MSGTISRSDRFTQTQNALNLYSDFLNDFTAHPITGDISRVINEQSVKQSLRNLILTNYGERLFQPTVGSNVLGSLFEFNDLTTASDLKFYISETIQNNEPRVSLQAVNVTETPDSNYVNIDILFSIINSQTIQTLNVIIKRVR